MFLLFERFLPACATLDIHPEYCVIACKIPQILDILETAGLTQGFGDGSTARESEEPLNLPNGGVNQRIKSQ
jgi:hypothetical protein